MAMMPLRKWKSHPHAQSDLARWPVLAAAFLIALFGLLAGTPRNADLIASARAADDRSQRSPLLAKRDHLRAVTVAERKDGTGSPLSHDDGFALPPFWSLNLHHYAAARALDRQHAPLERNGWPGALPRAPPAHA
jgi:hypothetical protein